jgi:putative ABC transport system ATP-binding protein
MPADLPRANAERPPDLVVARDVHKSFGQTAALTGASLAVAEREIVAIMGPSGSGKSTLLHCMAGILLPDSGEVWLAGRRLDTIKDTARTEVRRREFGFVFQFGQLVPELTAEENVALPLLLNGGRRTAAVTAAREWLGRVGLEGLGQRRSGELSGGQAQRVAVARALVSGPRVLFADEPTGSLDSVTGELVMELLVGIARAEKTTLVIVTHEAWVAGYADRIATVHDGQVISTPEQVHS